MTTASTRKAVSALPLIIMTTIAVAGWVSYYFAQQKATPPQPQAKLTTSEHRAKEEEWNSTLPTKASINTKHTTTMEPVATPDKTKQTTTAAAPVATPDKTRQTATAAPVATPNKTKQTTTTEPVATSDKTRQTATTEPVATSDKTRQTATAAPVVTPDKTKQTATTAPANAAQKATPKPPKRYNKLLMAERKKALNERDAAQTKIGTILKEKNTILKQKKTALKEGQQLRQQLVLSAENIKRLKQKIKEVSTDVQKVRKQGADRFSKLKQQFEQELKQKQITISQLKNRMTVVNVTAEILFGSGSATIKPKGQRVLELIAETLNKHPDRMISIEGHTDTLPIAIDSQYPTNWELSSARAASAARHLENIAGVESDRMQVVGHAQHRPTASNKTAKGRKTNRRIEIILLPPSTM